MTPPQPDVLLETDLATADDTRRAGRVLGGQLRAGDVLVLVGELGAGKTTFTQGLADGLGVRGPITSPTFVISRVHPSEVGGPALVHVDAYRLGDAAELEDIDLDLTLDTSVTVVEWGAGMAEQLSDSYLVVDLVRGAGLEAAADGGVRDSDDDGGDEHDDPRAIRIVGVGPRWTGAERLQL
ncbi:tRNA (adenosine(37)-N6)-threonylcarbamoyltransferase complex ATPase subunit type 1 TsaE [Mobilicoccus massiliensis]|uniref:tRNA (adenosine(37)-N6)-threonylcarbamoyltransferase complex ATPase subunit type 1 TsaE n=1 Tax=Mobilicoccus massiliensis TaxID=1522310 RepID=UPI000B008892|nr:tRNA (adenosine(37)-N6)-threonylcarbamoyltransferase complex ATPase subunit type 1 TsaE [Mobilicoccus massiliensis]